MSRCNVTPVFAALLAAALGGCQRAEEFTFAPVSGTVTRNGAPVANVRVIFYADPDAGTRGPRALGRTNAQGQYRLHADSGEDGAVLGQHRVCIMDSADLARFVQQRYEKDPAKVEKLAAKVALPQANAAAPAEPVQPAYNSIAQTPLRANVRSGAQTIDFDLH